MKDLTKEFLQLFPIPFGNANVNENTSNDLEKIFNSLFNIDQKIFPNSPSVDLYEENKIFYFKVSVADFNKDEIKVSIDKNNYLTVKAEKKEKIDETNRNYIHKGFSSKSFSRTIRLDKSITEKDIKVELQNGTILIIINPPELEEKKEKSLEINEINSSNKNFNNNEYNSLDLYKQSETVKMNEEIKGREHE